MDFGFLRNTYFAPFIEFKNKVFYLSPFSKADCSGQIMWYLLPLHRKPCKRPKINFVSIRRNQFSLTYSVMRWKKKVWMSCVCVLCVRLSPAVSLQPLDRIQFSNAHFFWFFDEDYAPGKIFGPIWAIFPIFFFFLISFFLIYEFLTFTHILVIKFIWKAMSRPLIWTSFECYFVYLKYKDIAFLRFFLFF